LNSCIFKTNRSTKRHIEFAMQETGDDI